MRGRVVKKSGIVVKKSGIVVKKRAAAQRVVQQSAWSGLIRADRVVKSCDQIGWSNKVVKQGGQIRWRSNNMIK